MNKSKITMQNYIKNLKRKLPFLKNEIFKKAADGTHFKVFISNSYAIRFRDKKSKVLPREVKLLKSLSHPLIPKVIISGEIDNYCYMVENRLPGNNMNIAWKNISKKNQREIISQIIDFIKFMQKTRQKDIYSVSTGKKYNSIKDFYLSDIDKKIANIRKIKFAEEILNDILKIINEKAAEKLFLKNTSLVLAHGDLIIHNLLTDGKALTGVIDWEMASFNNKDHDIFRILYYSECAKAYFDQKRDVSFEFDFIKKLINGVLKLKIIRSEKMFFKRYEFVRATFYLTALEWACNSKNSKKNIQEIKCLWNKNRANRF